MKAIQLESPQSFRPHRSSRARRTARGRSAGCGPSHRHLRHGLLRVSSAKCPSSATRASPATNSASKCSKSAQASRMCKPGDRCSVEPYMNCGQCYSCRRGQRKLLRKHESHRRDDRWRHARTHRPACPQIASRQRLDRRTMRARRDPRDRLPRRESRQPPRRRKRPCHWRGSHRFVGDRIRETQRRARRSSWM